MSESSRSSNPFAGDRLAVIRPAVEARFKKALDDAVAFMRAAPGAGMSGDDSGLADVFEEWADQLAFEHSFCFDLYDQVALDACSYVIDDLSPLEFSVLAAFTERCPDEEESLDEFDARSAVFEHVYGMLSEYGINYGEKNAEELERHRRDRDEPFWPVGG
ncbi:MAG: hypothetical protein AB7E70_03040 [Hyphomicrobiaceae bacterium]